jgi:P-type conjugative transfer protein VirB9
MKRLILAIALSAGGVAAYATDIPQGSKFDNRIQYVNYNAGDVVVVRTVAGLGTRVVFAPNEVVVDVASGFTQGWEFSDSGNILYIKAKSIKGENGQPSMAPTAGTWNTNLMVKTNLRMYDLDLQLLPGSNSGRSAANQQRIAYRVEYHYPAEEAAKAKAVAGKQAAQAKLDVKPAPRNWNYSMQIGEHSEGIAPTMAYDDGRFTYLKFPNNRDFPSAFLVAADKSESIVDSHIDPAVPDVLVLHRVARAAVLRLGNAVVGIYNDSFDPDGIPANEGTTVPGVKRVILGEAGK